MQSETKNCQNCKNDFVIEPDDFSFYEKIKVPAPTFCPYCRFLRRLSFNNFSTFYKNNCDSCGKSTICIYREDRPFKMYCNICWWKDNWDGTEYGTDYILNKPFFEQLLNLRDNSTFMALETLYPSLINTFYTNQSGYQKNCFMTIMADIDENCAYCTMVANSKDCLDCYRIVESELCFECIGVNKCYRCKWSEELDNCIDCYFCQSCNGCNNCVGCVNLKNKSYFILNKQYTKEEYFKTLESFFLDTYNGQKIMKENSEYFWMENPKRYYRGNALNSNVTGSYIYESKNTKESYMITGAEDCKYVQYLSVKPTNDCYDVSSWGHGAELCYECEVVGDGAYNNKFCVECWPQAVNMEYSYYCINCKDCFGCVNLKRKQYCILNKQYTKEEYLKLKEKIIFDMKENPWINKAGHIYTYGEFLPPELSAFGYNETVAQEHNPLLKESALNSGFNWFDIPKKEYNITLKSNLLPESIYLTKEKIKEEVVECEVCERGYNISDLEFELLSKLKQPVSHQCSNCRHNRRFGRTNGSKLYDRKCDKCGIGIRTSYSPERLEIVYCDKCYQQEVF